MTRFVLTIAILHIEPWPSRMLSWGMAPKWQNMLWIYPAYLRPWANGIGQMNAPATKISYIGIIVWNVLPVRTWVSPFPSNLNIGYSHCILTGNGSTNDAITFSTTRQIMHVIFFAPFLRGPRWLSDVSRSFLHYQCHIMSLNELWFDMNGAVYYLRGLQLMPIQQSQSMTQFTISFSNGRIVGHWQIVFSWKILLWSYKPLLVGRPPWSVMVPTNLFFLQRLVQPHGFWNVWWPNHPVLGNAQQLALGMKLTHTDVKFRDATLDSLAFLLLSYSLNHVQAPYWTFDSGPILQG